MKKRQRGERCRYGLKIVLGFRTGFLLRYSFLLRCSYEGLDGDRKAGTAKQRAGRAAVKGDAQKCGLIFLVPSGAAKR
jgi:hypothetical protein